MQLVGAAPVLNSIPDSFLMGLLIRGVRRQRE